MSRLLTDGRGRGRRNSLLAVGLCLSLASCTVLAQQIPDARTLQEFEQLLENISPAPLSTEQQDRIRRVAAGSIGFAHILLDNGHPMIALSLVENADDKLLSNDSTLTEIHELRRDCYLKIGDRRLARINDIRALESMRDRLGPLHQGFRRAISQFEIRWAEDTDISRDEILALTQWLQRDDTNSISGELIASSAAESRPITVPVWFGTNREKLDHVDPANYYGTQLGDLEVGKLTITIPASHKRSVIELPSSWSLAKADPKRHIVLQSIVTLDADTFATECCNEDEQLLFIHGYNVTFHDGALRAAQLAYDIDFRGSAHYFSWPSLGSIFGYLVDSNNVVPTRPALIDYLELITRGKSRLHIVAHSMGNRYLLEALEIFLRDNPDRQLGSIFFAAPDVDRLEFDVRVRSLVGRTGRTTLYSSATDRALQVSHQVNGRSRAGDTDTVSLLTQPIDTIDATGIGEDLLQHSYFGDTPTVLTDIFSLIRFDWSPDQRCTLLPADSADWQINNNGCAIEPLIIADGLWRTHKNDAAAEIRKRKAAATGEDTQLWQTVSDMLPIIIESRQNNKITDD